MATYDPFDWASSASGYDTPSRPVDQEIANGWTPGRVFTSSVLNWAFALLGRLASVAAKYDTLEDAAAGLSEGQIAWVFEESDGTYAAGSENASFLSASALEDVDASGDAFYITDSANGARKYLRTLSGGSQVTYSASNAGTPTAVAADGTSVVVAYGNYVECFDDDGTVRWEYDHGAAVNDVAIDGGQVYVCGATNGSSVEVLAFDINETGSVAHGDASWTYAHGAEVESIAVGGGRVILAGAAGTGGPTMRALSAADGSALWSRTPVAITNNRCLATDGRVVLAGFPTGTGHEVRVFGAEDGEQRLSRSLLDLSGAAVSARCVAMDADHFYVGFTNGSNVGGIYALERDSLAHAWTAQKEHSGNAMGCGSIAADGQALFACLEKPGVTPNAVRFRRGKGPIQVVAVDVANDYLPARQVVVGAGW